MRKMLVVLSLIISVLLVAACSNQTVNNKPANNQTASKPKVQETKPKHLVDVISYFKQKGFTIGEKSQKAYTMIQAVDGFTITLNGEQVELYEYDKADNSYLDNVKRTGKLGQFVATVNGKFLLAGGSDKIVQTFKEFK